MIALHILMGNFINVSGRADELIRKLDSFKSSDLLFFAEKKYERVQIGRMNSVVFF